MDLAWRGHIISSLSTRRTHGILLGGQTAVDAKLVGPPPRGVFQGCPCQCLSQKGRPSACLESKVQGPKSKGGPLSLWEGANAPCRVWLRFSIAICRLRWEDTETGCEGNQKTEREN